MEYSPKKIKENLEKENFNLKKKFGQNFIIDENIIDSIINKAEIDSTTLVLEIGPGAGSLTYKLAKKAKKQTNSFEEKTIIFFWNPALTKAGFVFDVDFYCSLTTLLNFIIIEDRCISFVGGSHA